MQTLQDSTQQRIGFSSNTPEQSRGHVRCYSLPARSMLHTLCAFCYMAHVPGFPFSLQPGDRTSRVLSKKKACNMQHALAEFGTLLM